MDSLNFLSERTPLKNPFSGKKNIKNKQKNVFVVAHLYVNKMRLLPTSFSEMLFTSTLYASKMLPRNTERYNGIKVDLNIIK